MYRHIVQSVVGGKNCCSFMLYMAQTLIEVLPPLNHIGYLGLTLVAAVARIE
jgi:hypothetical protein